MAVQGFNEYLIGVEETKKVLGSGAYATVLEFDYMGLKVAGKKLNEIHVGREDVLSRFNKACRLLCKASHPNIIQFLGIFSQVDSQLPILVMEKLPINLTYCISTCGVLPDEISYSILKGVALGLHFLHSQSFIHRNVSSNNVLLTSNMTAKLADIGTDDILGIDRSQDKLTASLRAYMPPEFFQATPQYSTSTDVFSFGILMIHMFSGELPRPSGGQIRIVDGKPIVNTEVERRNNYIKKIRHDQPLDLILKCIDCIPDDRGKMSDIVNHNIFTRQVTTSFSDRLTQLSNSIVDSESMGREKDEEISNLQGEADRQDACIKQLDERISKVERKESIKKLNQDMQKYSQAHADKRKALFEENNKLVDVFEKLPDIKNQIGQIKVTKPSEVTSSSCGKCTIFVSAIVMIILASVVIAGLHYFESHECNNKMKMFNETCVRNLSQSGKQVDELRQKVRGLCV